MSELNGKAALVSGASRGIGRATALTLAAAGAPAVAGRPAVVRTTHFLASVAAGEFFVSITMPAASCYAV